mgnify:CR=1 FL=1
MSLWCARRDLNPRLSDPVAAYTLRLPNDALSTRQTEYWTAVLVNGQSGFSSDSGMGIAFAGTPYEFA